RKYGLDETEDNDVGFEVLIDNTISESEDEDMQNESLPRTVQKLLEDKALKLFDEAYEALQQVTSYEDRSGSEDKLHRNHNKKKEHEYKRVYKKYQAKVVEFNKKRPKHDEPTEKVNIADAPPVLKSYKEAVSGIHGAYFMAAMLSENAIN
ncbi:hypothetical protein HDU76_011428, partial [Blyttiomyces sp. JEL0837]